MVWRCCQANLCQIGLQEARATYSRRKTCGFLSMKRAAFWGSVKRISEVWGPYWVPPMYANCYVQLNSDVRTLAQNNPPRSWNSDSDRQLTDGRFAPPESLFSSLTSSEDSTKGQDVAAVATHDHIMTRRNHLCLSYTFISLTKIEAQLTNSGFMVSKD